MASHRNQVLWGNDMPEENSRDARLGAKVNSCYRIFERQTLVGAESGN